MWPSSVLTTSSLTTLQCSNIHHGGHHHEHGLDEQGHFSVCQPGVVGSTMSCEHEATSDFEDCQQVAVHFHPEPSHFEGFDDFSCTHPNHSFSYHGHCEWAPSTAGTTPREAASFPEEADGWKDTGHDTAPRSSQPRKSLRVAAREAGVHEIYEEIVGECEHFLKKSDCHTCRGRWLPLEESSPFPTETPSRGQSVEGSIAEEESPEKILVKKRQQNKQAAARYRDKQKTNLLEELKKQTEKNTKLKETVQDLETQVRDYKQRLEEHIRSTL